MKLHYVILDDYQNVALSRANWTSISDEVEVDSFVQHVENEDELVNLIEGYEMIVIMRERTTG
ncbi:hypothetical protein [Bacillus sp. EB600]|uniref:hypothetical protein n=1 Tax=Bacillus sp. EB600 TaxID=2806345 RepID=UPI00210C7F73|nr:hypothetical protein [Bacillus sp. EB600]MCQ6277648.1 hypothetical protein [Bacillus sp. EB600]